MRVLRDHTIHSPIYYYLSLGGERADPGSWLRVPARQQALLRAGAQAQRVSQAGACRPGAAHLHLLYLAFRIHDIPDPDPDFEDQKTKIFNTQKILYCIIFSVLNCLRKSCKPSSGGVD
jgi:hypothetical protein